MVEVRQGLAGERRRLGLERNQLGVQPRPTVRIGHLGGEAIAECRGVIAKPGRGAELLHVDLGLEIGRPKVAVDQPRDPLVQPKCQQQVVLRDRVGRRDEPGAANRGDPVVPICRAGHRCIRSGLGARAAS